MRTLMVLLFAAAPALALPPHEALCGLFARFCAMLGLGAGERP